MLLFFYSVIHPQTSTTSDTSQKVFQKVEVEASYPGDIPAWRTFLEKNLNASVPIDNGAPSGMYFVIVQFIVNKEGGISDIKALTSLGFGMEEEVVRIMRKSGLWTPAIMDGKPVNAYRKQPVTFLVTQEGFEIISKTPYALFTNTDNQLTIRVDDVTSENLEATISEGTLTNNGDGNFTARVNKPGRTVITVFTKKKKRKKLVL